MRYLGLGEVLDLHRRLAADAGGPTAVRDMGALESAIAQPRMQFGGEDLYSDLAAKAGAMAFSLIQNHPFVDGNKRTAFVAAELFLDLNGVSVTASDEECVITMLRLAAGEIGEDDYAAWLRANAVRQD